jgi:hypothetical protein
MAYKSDFTLGNVSSSSGFYAASAPFSNLPGGVEQGDGMHIVIHAFLAQNNGIASAAATGNGTGGANGTGVYALTGGASCTTTPTVNVTWASGVLTINSVANAGVCSTLPNPTTLTATLTYISGAATGWAGATVSYVPLSLAAGAKSGNVSWWCLNIPFNIPQSAWGGFDLVADYSHWQQDATYGQLTIKSSAGVTEQPSLSSGVCNFGGGYGAAVSMNATSGSDLVQVQSMTFTPFAPTYSTSTPRP